MRYVVTTGKRLFNQLSNHLPMRILCFIGFIAAQVICFLLHALVLILAYFQSRRHYLNHFGGYH
jgi:hypothetical protein